MELVARPRAVDPTADVGLLTLAVAGGITAAMRERLAASGFDDVRDSHGYVVQGLLAGDTTVTALAARLGVSVQAVSKSVTELERAGYVRRGHDPDDFVHASRSGRARHFRPAYSESEAKQSGKEVPARLRRRVRDLFGSDVEWHDHEWHPHRSRHPGCV